MTAVPDKPNDPARPWDVRHPSAGRLTNSARLARHELNDLAPEMAEAILAVSDADISVYDDVPEAHALMNQLDVLAEKLRAIGGTNA